MRSHGSGGWWEAVLLAGLIGHVATTAQSAAPPLRSPPLTRVAEVRTLTPAEAAQGYPVRLQCVVTFCDSASGLLFVQDATGGVYVAPQEPVVLVPGHRVEVTGIAQGGSHLPFVARGLLFDQGPATLPEPRPVTFDHLASGAEDSNWIQTEGVVRSVRRGNGRVSLVLAASGKRVLARIPQDEGWALDPSELVDAEVRLQGVAGAPSDRPADGILLDIHVPYSRLVEVRNRGTPALRAPLRSSAWLRESFPTNALVHRIRVRGQIESEPGTPVRLRDESGTLELVTADLPLASLTNARVEVAGFPSGGPEHPRLDGAMVALLSQARGETNASAAPPVPGPEDYLPVLTEVQQVRSLPSEEASRGYPVRVQAVVTFAHRMTNGLFLLFVQDGTAGIYVDANPPEPGGCPPGRVVEIRGTSDPGAFAPIIRSSRLVVLGESVLPPGRLAGAEDLMSGRLDSQRVRVQGVVTGVRRELEAMVLGLLVGDARVEVWVPPAVAPPEAERLVDAAVRVDGVCGTQLNARRQLTGIVVHLPRWTDLQVVRPPPADLAEVPLRTIRSLYRFDPAVETHHRVRVRGTVSLPIPGVGVFLQDASDGLFVATDTEEPLTPGDVVDVTGFPPCGGPNASFLEARWQRAGVREPLVAERASPGGLAAGELDNRLVALEARLLERRSRSNQVVLVCQTEDRIVEALALPPGVRAAAAPLALGSRLRLTGVWVAPADLLRLGQTAALWLREPSDLLVLEQPPWWTPRHAALLGAGLSALVLAALGWVALLRRTVAERTAQSRRTLALLEAAIAQSPSGILIADAPDVRIRHVNAAALAIRGEPASELSEISVQEHARRWQTCRPDGSPYPPEELPLSRAVLKGEVTRNEELIIRNPDGEDRWVEANAAPVREHQGPITSGIVVFHDITARKRIERIQTALARISELALATPTLAELLPAIDRVITGLLPAPTLQIALRSGTGPAATRVYSRPPVTPSSSTANRGPTLLESVLETGETRLVEGAKPAPTEAAGTAEPDPRPGISWLGVPLRLQSQTLGAVALGDPSGPARYGAADRELLLLLSYPVANAIQHKQVEQALRESEEKFARAFQLSPDAIHLNRADDDACLEVNDGFCAITGYSRAEAVGRPFLASGLALWVDAQERDGLMATLRSRGEVTDAEIRIRCKAGRQITGLVSARLITIRGTLCVLTILRDITARKLAEAEREALQQQLLHAHKLESVGRLAGGVAHEYNNMLQVILGNVALALEATPPANPVHESLKEIERAAQRSAESTRQLLAFARKQTVHPRVLDLNAAVSGMLRLLQRLLHENIQLSWLPGPNLGCVRLDPGQVDQLLANLVVNARDALRGSGQIRIQTANVTVDDAWARRNPEAAAGEFVQLAVSDTGVGMDDETRAHVFEPFFTTKPVGQGTGLGLATVYGIVKQNGGFIEVRSEPGRGTTFQILLPRTSTTPEAAVVAAAKSPRGTETVLLVEDEPQVLDLGRRILETHGYTVLTAANPGEALRQAATCAGPLHLLLTDVLMPGMNGRDLSHRVLELRPDARALFMSGHPADVIAHQGLLAAGVRFLQKPFTVDELARAVREALDAT